MLPAFDLDRTRSQTPNPNSVAGGVGLGVGCFPRSTEPEPEPKPRILLCFLSSLGSAFENYPRPTESKPEAEPRTRIRWAGGPVSGASASCFRTDPNPNPTSEPGLLGFGIRIQSLGASRAHPKQNPNPDPYLCGLGVRGRVGCFPLSVEAESETKTLHLTSCRSGLGSELGGFLRPTEPESEIELRTRTL